MRKQGGYNLVEIMVALALLGLIMTMGVASFRGVTQRSNLRAQTNKVIAALNLARSEAIKRSLAVSVCPSASGTACDDSTDWAGNLIVFVDRETAGDVDTDDDVVQVFDAAAPNVTVTSTVQFVQYLGSGLTNLAATETVDIFNAGCSGANARQVAVTVAGRTSSTQVDCP